MEMTCEQALLKIAENQQGFFTAKQASNCGCSLSHDSRQIRSGEWVQEHRGIYRIANLQRERDPDNLVQTYPNLMLWFLWFRNRDDIPQAVYSYLTALSFYKLLKFNRMEYHVTIPKTFKKNSTLLVTGESIEVHKADLPEKDTVMLYGVKVTSLPRTFIDIIDSGLLPNDAIQKMLSKSLKHKLIEANQLLEHPLAVQNQTLLKKIIEVLK